MPESKAQRLAAALDDFIRSSPDVEAAAVVSFTSAVAAVTMAAVLVCL